MKLLIKEGCEVTPESFQACLNYTITAKLAPNWNLMGRYYVQGRDFLTQTGPLTAITDMQLTVGGSDITLALDAVVIRLPQMQTVLKVFNGEQCSQVPTEYTWGYVLPSFKRCQIVNITKSVRGGSPFKNHEELKRYWKNMYGYRLPEQPTLYYNISFRNSQRKVFLYPEYCVRPFEPTVVPRIDPRPIVAAFLCDLRLLVGQICGYDVNFTSDTVIYPDFETSLIPSVNYTEPREEPFGLRNTLPVLGVSLRCPYSLSKPNDLLPSSDNQPFINHKQISFSQPVSEVKKDHTAFLTKSSVSSSVAGSSCCITEHTSQKIYPVFLKQNNLSNNSQSSKMNNTRHEDTTLNRIVPTFHAKKKVPTIHVSKLGPNSQVVQENGAIHVSIGKASSVISTGTQSTIASTSGKIQPIFNARCKKEGSKCMGNVKRRPTILSGNSMKQARLYQFFSQNNGSKEIKLEVKQDEVLLKIKSNQLNKITVPTLLSWLRVKGIPCRAKDKKSVLIEKVLEVIKTAGK